MRYTLTNHLQFLKRMRERKRENETKNTQQLIIKLKCFGRLTNLFVEKASKCEEWTTEKMQDEYWSDCGFVSMLQWWQMDGRLDGKWSCLDTNKGIILSSAYKFQAPTWFVLHGFWFTIFRSKPRSFFPFFFSSTHNFVFFFVAFKSFFPNCGQIVYLVDEFIWCNFLVGFDGLCCPMVTMSLTKEVKLYAHDDRNGSLIQIHFFSFFVKMKHFECVFVIWCYLACDTVFIQIWANVIDLAARANERKCI